MCFDECLDSFDSYRNETDSFVYSWCWSSRNFQTNQTSVGALMILLSGNKDLSESQFYKLSTAMLRSFILVSSFSPRPTTFKPFCPLRARTVWDIRCKRITMSLKVETFLSMGTVNNDLVWPLGGASQPLTSCLFSFFLLFFVNVTKKRAGRGD